MSATKKRKPGLRLSKRARVDPGIENLNKARWLALNGPPPSTPPCPGSPPVVSSFLVGESLAAAVAAELAAIAEKLGPDRHGANRRSVDFRGKLASVQCISCGHTSTKPDAVKLHVVASPAEDRQRYLCGSPMGPATLAANAVPYLELATLNAGPELRASVLRMFASDVTRLIIDSRHPAIDVCTGCVANVVRMRWSAETEREREQAKADAKAKAKIARAEMKLAKLRAQAEQVGKSWLRNP